LKENLHEFFAARPSREQATTVALRSTSVWIFIIAASTNQIPKAGVKKDRRQEQKQCRDDEETTSVENEVVWRTLEEVFALNNFV